MSLLFVILGFSFVLSIHATDVECINKIGGKSGKNDDDKSSATCPSGYTLTSCGIWGAWKNIDGSYISGNKCYAQMGAGGGNYVRAYARCCKLHSTASCSNRVSGWSAKKDDAKKHKSCINGKKVLGCTAYSAWKNIDGSSPTKEYPHKLETKKLITITDQQCTAFSGGTKVKVYSRCCKHSGNDYKFECGYIVGSKSGTKDDDESTIGCPSGYFMSGCSGYSPWKSAEAWYINNNNKCKARNMAGGKGVWAVAICCKEIKKPEVECINKIGSKSGKKDDDKSVAQCGSGYSLTSCGIWGAWKNIDGSYITDNKCYAQMGAGGGNYVRAYARCCKLHSSASCSTYKSGWSAQKDDAKVSKTCGSNKKVTGCTAYSAWKNIDGSSPTKKYPHQVDKNKFIKITKQYCYAFSGSTKVKAVSQCCSYSNDDYDLDCGYVVGTKSGQKDDDESIIYCPSGYFMSGCSGYSPWKSAEAWYIDSQDRCRARNMGGGKGVWAVAICCKETKEESSSSSSEPPPPPPPAPEPEPEPEPSGCGEVNAKHLVLQEYHNLAHDRIFMKKGDLHTGTSGSYFRYEFELSHHFNANTQQENCIKTGGTDNDCCWHISLHIHDAAHKDQDRIYAYDFSNNGESHKGDEQFLKVWDEEIVCMLFLERPGGDSDCPIFQRQISSNFNS